MGKGYRINSCGPKIDSNRQSVNIILHSKMGWKVTFLLYTLLREKMWNSGLQKSTRKNPNFPILRHLRIYFWDCLEIQTLFSDGSNFAQLNKGKRENKSQTQAQFGPIVRIEQTNIKRIQIAFFFSKLQYNNVKLTFNENPKFAKNCLCMTQNQNSLKYTHRE